MAGRGALLSAIKGGGGGVKLRSAKAAPPVKQLPVEDKKPAPGGGGGMPNIAMLAMAARGNLKKTGKR